MTRSTKRKVRIIGVPLDLGQERRGVDMGPSALRVADLNARLRAKQSEPRQSWSDHPALEQEERFTREFAGFVDAPLQWRL